MKSGQKKWLVVVFSISCLWACKSTKPSNKNQTNQPKSTSNDTIPLVQNNTRPEPLNKLSLPSGFEIAYYAQNVGGARSMVLGDKGTVFVGSRNTDKVYALVDSNGDQKVDDVLIVAKGLNTPNGVAFRKGSLYVAEIDRILRFDNIEENLKNPPKPVVVYDKYPTETHHGWKYIAFGPDDKLYVPVGAPCNVCDSKDPVFATITRLDPDGSNREIVAAGIRNTVGFDWHPETGELWFTDNGRDWLGDNAPADELNVVTKKGEHFGYPYCHADGMLDPKFGDQKKCNNSTKPTQQLGPHVAALGMTFYTGKAFPKRYKNQIFIAEHGSWNRSTPIGYQVSLVEHDGKRKGKSYIPFVQGWLTPNGKVWGRPVDVIVMPDGALLVSDDRNNAIYRIWYTGKP